MCWASGPPFVSVAVRMLRWLPSAFCRRALGIPGVQVYSVRLADAPSCDCPDFARRQQACKHVLFVYLRVLHAEQDDKRISKPRNPLD